MSLRIAAFVLTVACSSAAPVLAQTSIVRNVNGYALSANGVESFSAMVIVDGKVSRLIGREQSAPTISGATVIDGEGKTLLPGLIDAHGHVSALGSQRLEVDLRGSASVEAALAAIKKFAADNKSNAWVLGRGWNQVLWPSKKFPTAGELDSVVADRPALMSRVDGHAIWANTAALKLAGIAATTPDPAGGQILRDASGRPTGVLVDAATSLVERRLPRPTQADVVRTLSAALTELNANGLTGVHDAGIDSLTYAAYQELGRQNRLTVRVYAMLSNNEDSRETIKAGPIPPAFDDKLYFSSIKAYADGALGSRGAAMLEDYSDQPGHRGLKLTSESELRSLAELAGKYGWQLNVHAIGDEGNRIALNAFERGMTAEQRKKLRPRIEHAQVIALTDIPRFAALGAIASIQPTHATSDMNMAEDRVGANRIKGAYAWRTLRNAGARLAGGSDFPVELSNPFHGLYAAVTRKNRQGQPAQGWYPKEKLTREEALRLFTTDAAFAANMEARVGGLMPGQWADFILIDADYFTVPEDKIDDINAVATYVGGQRVTGNYVVRNRQ